MPSGHVLRNTFFVDASILKELHYIIQNILLSAQKVLLSYRCPNYIIYIITRLIATENILSTRSQSIKVYPSYNNLKILKIPIASASSGTIQVR